MNLQEQSILGNGGKMYVLLVELKKGKEKVTDQLAAGECFAKFIVDTTTVPLKWTNRSLN